MLEWKDDITQIGNKLGLDGKFLVEFGFDQIKAEADEMTRVQQENAALLDLLTEIGNEFFHATEYGEWYAEQGDSAFMQKLAKKLNDLILM